MPSLLHHHSQHDVRSGKSGFTLTELFVSVLIVFLVAFIVFPLFAKARSPRRQYSGAANQKQIAIAFLNYIQDYDETFPPAVGYVPLPSVAAAESSALPPNLYIQSWGPQRVLSNGKVVTGILYPYAKSNSVFIDPRSHQQNPGKGFLDYMYNDLLVARKIGAITSAPETVLLIDAEDRFGNAGHAFTPDSGPYSAVFNSKGGCDAGQGASIRSARFRFSGGAFVGFTDGHVKWFKGGTDDAIFFPARESASVSSVDPQTKQQIGPQPGTAMVFQGRRYSGTFHIR